MIIRREEKEDIRVVEELIRDAFWNVYGPGQRSIMWRTG